MSLLHSARTNETFLSPLDPRVPPAIQALKPHEILVIGSIEAANPHVIIVRAGRPAVYDFWLRPSYPKPWILSAAGPGYKGLEEVDFSGSAGYEPITDLQ